MRLYALSIAFVLAVVSSARAEPFAYVPDVLGSEVSVIDLAAGSVVTTIPTPGLGVDAVATSIDGTRVYVGGNDIATSAGAVVVIDVATNAVVDTVTNVGTSLTAIALSPDGLRIYATNFNNAVQVIDTVTNTLIDEIVLPGTLVGIVVHPDGSRLYVSDFTGFVHVLDRATQTLNTSIALPQGVEPITVDGDGMRVYAAYEGSGGTGLVSIDTATDTLVTDLPTEFLLRDVATTCGLVWATNEDDHEVTVFTVEPLSVIGAVPVAGGPVSIDARGDGAAVYATDVSGDRVFEIAVSTMNVVDTITTGNPFAQGRFITGALPTCSIFEDGFESGNTAVWSATVP